METIIPRTVRNNRYKLIGSIFIILNYFRHLLFGYKRPRPFSASNIEAAAEYDLKITREWLRYLRDYTGEENPVKEKVILEIVPGPDLGTGMILINNGARDYYAFDVNKLAVHAPEALYSKLSQITGDRNPDTEYKFSISTDGRGNLRKIQEKLKYIVDARFDIRRLTCVPSVIVSQAVFEHVTDVDKSIMDLSSITPSGGVFFAEIDLKTHTTWIRDKDPLNIYRYGDGFWNLFKFKGTPNRVRAYEYVQLLEKYGWEKVLIRPRVVLSQSYLSAIRHTLNGKFRELSPQEMRILSFVILATKK
jgi:hypothetical protein